MPFFLSYHWIKPTQTFYPSTFFKNSIPNLIINLGLTLRYNVLTHKYIFNRVKGNFKLHHNKANVETFKASLLPDDLTMVGLIWTSVKSEQVEDIVLEIRRNLLFWIFVAKNVWNKALKFMKTKTESLKIAK